MGKPVLVLGNKNTSSWSMRPWLMFKAAGVEFEEIFVPLRRPESKANILAHSPSGLVPALKVDGLVIWDSLAIGEWAAETYPDAHLWPVDKTKRAIARAVSAEMHSGFRNLRMNLPMDIAGSFPGEGMSEEVAVDIKRITEVWTQCRRDFGQGGPFLFGAFTIADAMYAPVVSRFTTYAVEVNAACQDYMDAIWSYPPMGEWKAAALRERTEEQGG